MTLLKVEADSLMLVFVQELEEKRIRDSIAEAHKDTTLTVQKDTLFVAVKDSLNLKKKDASAIAPKLIEPRIMQ